jgi:hypothetical protein
MFLFILLGQILVWGILSQTPLRLKSLLEVGSMKVFAVPVFLQLLPPPLSMTSIPSLLSESVETDISMKILLLFEVVVEDLKSLLTAWTSLVMVIVKNSRTNSS